MDQQLEAIIHCFQTHNVTASKFLVSLLTDAGFQEHPCSEDLVHNSTEIFNAFLKHPKASGSALDWANTVMKKKYAKDIKDLANVKNGWHFGALHTSEEQLKDFRIEDMAHEIQRLAPELWDLLGLMLSADRKQRMQQQTAKDAAIGGDRTDKDGDHTMSNVEDDEEDLYWEGQGEFNRHLFDLFS